MPVSRAVGIDLGTTRCAVAVVDETGRSAMVRSDLGEMLIPSVVFFEDEELVFGRPARQAAGSQPNRAAEFVKRDLGQPSYSRAIDGQLLPAELIEGCLLAMLTSDLADSLGARPAAVLTHPGCFNQAQRQALLDAAQIAGLDVVGTISDPLAVALALAETQGYLQKSPGEKPACRALVFDLGGGKLDVAIVEIKTSGLRSRAIGGDARLGGRDWDVRLADHLASEFAAKFGEDPRHDMASVRRLLELAEEAKHTLSARQQAQVRVERAGNSVDVTITRQAFDRMTADLVERAQKATERVLAQASMAWRDLTHLLVIGGASRMPMIGKMLETITWMKGAASVHAEEAVVRGAALYAEQRLARRERRAAGVNIQITDQAAHSLGLEWLDPATGRTENVVLIPRGTELPSTTTSKVTTQLDDQSSITLKLLEGESRNAAECIPIAHLVISNIPSNAPRYSPIEVVYQFTAEGRLNVKAKMQHTGDDVSVELQPAGGLTPVQVAAWKKLVAGKVGLRAIHAELIRQQAEQTPTAADSAAIAQAHVPPPALPSDGPAEPEPTTETAELESHYAVPAIIRVRRAKNSQRKLLINVVGYLVFSALGLAIGYYIVMFIWPEWNIYHLPLPGLK